MICTRKLKIRCSGLSALLLLTLAVPSILAQEGQPATQPARGRLVTGQLAAIRQRGELRVAVATFMPWAMRNNKGELMGFEIEVARQLARDLGVEVKFIPTPQSELIPDLDTGRFDIIASGLSVIPTRALQINFSDFYNQSAVTLLANRKLARNLKTADDFNKPGVKIGVRTGTLNVELAKRYFPRAHVQEFSDTEEMLDSVRAETLHAAIASNPRPDIDALRFPDKVFLPLHQPLMTQGEAFGIPKGDPDFLNYLNAWIKYYEQNGWLDERRTFWFKTLNWADDL